ncbi:MAG: translation elongation factor Ts [Rhabdochlamydiaceae bacterium]|nr:translation elongation factor Ts [Candidatus Amphrikana amoebophyrae]
MSNVTASMVKELRDRTGVGMGKCKKALDEAKGDVEEAISILRKSGMASAEKKQSRDTNEGMIGFKESDSHVAIVEINAETDFVVQNERFQAFVEDLCAAALENKPTSVEEFSSVQMQNGMSVEEYRADHIQTLGENIKVRKVSIMSKEGDTSIGVYSHMGGKIVATVEIVGSSEATEFARAVAMHVAAEFPEYLSPEGIPADIIARETDIAKDQVKTKPENIQEKIIQGKLAAFYDQNCLLRQKYIRDPSKTVAAVVEEEGKKLGKTLTLKSFTRWQIGA